MSTEATACPRLKPLGILFNQTALIKCYGVYQAPLTGTEDTATPSFHSTEMSYAYREIKRCGVGEKHKCQSQTDMGLKPDLGICWLCDLDELLNHSEPPFPNL